MLTFYQQVYLAVIRAVAHLSYDAERLHAYATQVARLATGKPQPIEDQS